MEEKQILDRLWDNYELSHSAAMAQRQPVENLTKTNREIAELRRGISALGTPNLGAIEEYERGNSRYEFLAGQRDDVEKARRELLEINPRTNVIFLTAYMGYSFDAWSTGACGFILKPISASEVRKQITLLRYPVRGLI